MKRALDLRQRLRGGPPLLATFSILASPEAVEMAGIAGFDAIILDLEHGPFDLQALPSLLSAARSRDLFPLVRVRNHEPSAIGAVLDAGAAGVLVPHVSSAEDAAALVQAGRFPPEGKRGVNPWVRAADFGARPDWLTHANGEIALIAMVEGPTGLASIEGILSTPSLDAIFLGPVDLAAAIGVPGQPEHPHVIERTEAAIRSAREHDVAVCVFAPTPQAGARWLDRGAHLVAVSVDTAILLGAFQQTAMATRSATVVLPDAASTIQQQRR